MQTNNHRVRIAVDAMGGDFAPRNVVAGAVEALRREPAAMELLLVGREDLIRAELGPAPPGAAAPTVVHAPQVITMDDGPTAALRQKRDSSIAVGLGLQRDGNADAFVSAGNTGAVMTASTLILGKVPGVSRPTIGTFFPSRKGVCLIVDAGANVDCRPRHLMEFGVMGSVYTEAMFGIARPAVGLLNVGEEETKGNEAALEAHALLAAAPVNFVGNVEGRDILDGRADVVVCDGFVGNILLKFAESIPAFLRDRIRGAVGSNPLRKLALVPALSAFRGAMKSLDYEEYGGVPLLGVRGVSIIGHGKSTPKAIANMILRARETALSKIDARIERVMVPAA